MRLSAILPLLALLASTSATSPPGNGVVRAKRQGGICKPAPSAPSSSVSPAPTAAGSGSATATASDGASATTSDSATTTAADSASNSAAPTSASASPTASGGTDSPPTESSVTRTDYPISDIELYNLIWSDPPDGGRSIRVAGRPDLCVMVQQGENYAGLPIAISTCLAHDMYNTQRWDLPDGYAGTLKSHQSPDLCFQMDDIDKDPKLQNCADTEPRQAFQWTGDGLLHVDGQCLAVNETSFPNPRPPYGLEKRLCSLPCDAADPYQRFTLYDGPDDPPRQ